MTHIALLAAIAFLACAGRAVAQTCDSSPLIVRNTNVWTRQGLLEHRDVLVRDGRVAAITESKHTPSGGLRALDGSGHTLLPGLIDSHLHFVVPGGLPATGSSTRDAGEITGRQLLRSGVTSGRLHLASLDAAQALKGRSIDDCAPLPRLHVGGPGFGGASEADTPQFWSVKSVDDAKAKVDRVAAAKLDWIALHDADKFAPDVLEAIAESARTSGIRLMGAGTRPEEIDVVIRVNPDTLDYFDQSEQPAYAPALRQSIRRRSGMVLVPTVGVYHRIGTYLARPSLLEEAFNFEFLQEAERAFVLANARSHLANTSAITGVRRVLPSLRRKLQQLRQLGLPLAVGSDAGSPIQFQSGAMWWELEAWRALGASHREVLIAATDGGARVLGATDVGRLAVGSRADFVLYRDDVERGPFDASRVIAVAKGGVLYVADGKWTGY